MKKINLYNNKFDYLILNKKEIDNLDLDYDASVLSYGTKKCSIIHHINTNETLIDINNVELKLDYINVIALKSISHLNDNLEKWIDLHADTEFKIYLIVDNVSEREIFFPNSETKDLSLIDKISKTKNIKVLHHLINFSNKNFIFCPKLLFYGMINHVPSTILYDYFYKYFPTLKKEYRIGFHINRLYDGIRLNTINMLIDSNLAFNKNIFCTINENEKNSEFYDKKFDKFLIKNSMIHEHGRQSPHGEWYLSNFFDLSVKSDIELVYETNPATKIHEFYKNLTEKSIKPIMLGKPIIYIDKNSHNFIKKFGFKTYDILLNNDLNEIYNSSLEDEYNSSLDWRDKHFNKHLRRTISSILDMDETDYNILLNECKLIAEYNKNLFNKIMYEESIINLLN